MNLSDNNRGFSLILSVFIILAFSALGLMVLNLLTTQTDTYIQDINSTQAFYLAEAARDFFYEYNLAGSDFTSTYQFPELSGATAKAFGNGKFEISYSTPRQMKTETVTFRGTVANNSRTITQTFDALKDDSYAKTLIDWPFYFGSQSDLNIVLGRSGGKHGCAGSIGLFGNYEGNPSIRSKFYFKTGITTPKTLEIRGGNSGSNDSTLYLVDIYSPGIITVWPTDGSDKSECFNTGGWYDVTIHENSPVIVPRKDILAGSHCCADYSGHCLYEKEFALARSQGIPGTQTIDTLELNGESKYFRDGIITLSGIIKGPGSIVVAKSSINGINSGIVIADWAKVSERINLITDGYISVGSVAYVGLRKDLLPYVENGAGSLLYARGEPGITAGAEVTKVLLGSSCVITGTVLTPDESTTTNSTVGVANTGGAWFYGLIHTGRTGYYSISGGSISSFREPLDYQGVPTINNASMTGGGSLYSIPLRVKGLYNIAGPRQDQ